MRRELYERQHEIVPGPALTFESALTVTSLLQRRAATRVSSHTGDSDSDDGEGSAGVQAARPGRAEYVAGTSEEGKTMELAHFEEG